MAIELELGKGIVIEGGITIGDVFVQLPRPAYIVTDSGNQLVTQSGDFLVTAQLYLG